MRNYEDVGHLVADMFNMVNVDEPVSVIADKDVVVEIMQEMLTYENTTIDYCNIDILDYDKEYVISLCYDNDDEKYYIVVDRAYNYDTEKYNRIGGYVLLHEEANSKALIDMQNYEEIFLTGHDWFIIGEDDSFEIDEEEENNQEDPKAEETIKDSDKSANGEYTVTVKCNVDPDDVSGLVRDVERSVLHMYEMFDEMNRFRRLLGW